MNIIEIYKKFPSEASWIDYLERIRRNSTPKCPYCNSTNSTPMTKERRHHCNGCNTAFSVTVGTIFHHTRVDLQRWFLAIAIILDAKDIISARQLARDIVVNPNTAWTMSMKIRRAVVQDKELLYNIVKMNELHLTENVKQEIQ